MKKYCEECGKEVNTKIITKKEIYDVCGESIEVEDKILVCENCGEEFFCEELDNATLVKAYNEYRRRHKLLFPEEIKEIREKYGLSQRSFAKLLNWGDKTIFRYENGSIQDKAHNSLLLFLRDPENMKTYLSDNEVVLSENKKKRLLSYVAKLEQKEDVFTGNRILNQLFANEPCEENGFRSFDYEKVCAMVLYFANKNRVVLKTKMMKLLDYSDMIFYKENGISISGMQYAHLPYGPVPVNFDIILGSMEADNVAHIEIIYENEYEKHQIVPDRAMPKGVLSKEEIEVLERINKKFKNYGSVEISNYSHKEKGYIETQIGEVISYAYAKDIEL